MCLHHGWVWYTTAAEQYNNKIYQYTAALILVAAAVPQSITHNKVVFVIRLSLGKLLVNLSQVVVKRTKYPTNTFTNGVVDRTWVFRKA